MPRKLLVLLAMVIACSRFTSAQEIASLASSPKELARFVDTHSDFDWEPLWKALGLKDDEAFLPLCERENDRTAPCSSKLITVANPLQTILILEHEFSNLQVFLRYKPANKGMWRFADAYSPNVKYFTPEHRIVQIGPKPFFVFTEQGISGSGVSSKIESWVDLGKHGFDPALSFTAEGSYFPSPDGIARKSSCQVASIESQPLEKVSVNCRVEFSSEQLDKQINLGKRTDRFVYLRTGSHDFKLDGHRSTATAKDVEMFYDITDAPFEVESFLKFNFRGLSDVATGNDQVARLWLSDLLDQAQDTEESRRLKALLASH